jgi:hypothetical protein
MFSRRKTPSHVKPPRFKILDAELGGKGTVLIRVLAESERNDFRLSSAEKQVLKGQLLLREGW